MIPFGYAGKPLPAANRTAARAVRLPAQAVPFRPLRLRALEHDGRLGGRRRFFRMFVGNEAAAFYLASPTTARGRGGCVH